MDLPPDPYKALGVSRDATAAAIKTQYRKLVLKFHPDKVKDEAQKQEAADQFHRVQTAYEIVGDEKRRGRYDAQCKLHELRRDVMGGGDVRTASFKVPTESTRGGEFYTRGPERSGRMSPQYEERRPRDMPQDYFGSFEMPPRSSARKDAEYERSSKPSKRAPSREEHKKSKSSSKGAKENERSSRREKSRRTEQDTRRDRDRKYAYVEVEEQSSESDGYERWQRKVREQDDLREDPELRRAREDFARGAQRRREDAEAGIYYNERVQKIFSQESVARDYIASRGRQAPERERERPSSERRPSPVRNRSSRDKVEFVERRGQSPIRIRRGSGLPRTTEGDRQKSSSREKDIRATVEVVEDAEEIPTRRPPPLNHSNSSPPEIRIPAEKLRSQSLQEHEPPMVPKMKRAETMPYSPTTGGQPEPSRPKETSKLRRGESAYLTPETSPEPLPRKFSYGHAYADDGEYATPDGYQRQPYHTEVREPERPRNLSSSPPKADLRSHQRSTSAKYPSQAPPQQSKRYFYGDTLEPEPRRPSLSRENSGPARLFGEVPTTLTSRSPRPPVQKFSPPPEDVLYSRKPTEKDVKKDSGYKVRGDVRRGSEKERINTSSRANAIYSRA